MEREKLAGKLTDIADIGIVNHKHDTAVLREAAEAMQSLPMNEYQELAARTINSSLTREETLRHALFEMCGELGEIHSIYQKVYQGHKIMVEDLKQEVGDLLWGIAEFCTVNGFRMEDIARLNIEKLKKRYPEGFDPDRSLHRIEYEEDWD